MSSGSITVRYWAGARAAAGIEDEQVTTPPGRTVEELVADLGARHPQLVGVLRVATLLRDGRALERRGELVDGDLVEVLPPFAGG